MTTSNVTETGVGLRVRDIMSESAVTVKADTSVGRIA